MSTFSFLWRRKWQPTPVFLPGKSHGWRSLLGYSPWGHKELDTTERLTRSHSCHLPQIFMVKSESREEWIKSPNCHSVLFSSVAESCLTLSDPMDCSTPSLPVHHQLLEFTQTRVGDAIQTVFDIPQIRKS